MISLALVFESVILVENGDERGVIVQFFSLIGHSPELPAARYGASATRIAQEEAAKSFTVFLSRVSALLSFSTARCTAKPFVFSVSTKQNNANEALSYQVV